jgi:outer membrane protein assembly factor BamB
MRRLTGLAAIWFGCPWVWTGAAVAQGGRGGSDWTTDGGDAQRSSWVRTDPKISSDSLRRPGFGIAWKIKLGTPLTPAVLLERYIGYRGFRSLAFVGGSSGNAIAIDTDLGRVEWQKPLPASSSGASSSDCPGGMTASLTRPTGVALPAVMAGRGGGGGRGAAKSGVGQPGEGAVTLAEAVQPRGGGFPAPPAAAGRGAPPAGRGGGRMPNFVYALSSDGMLHSMYVSNGDEPQPPVRFLPAYADAHGLIVVDNVAYAVTTHGCGGVANGVWALDLASKQVSTWKSNGGTLGPAFGPDGTLFVTTDGAEPSLMALDPKTLQVKDSYLSGSQAFASPPVVFEYKGKILATATTKDGRVHLLDGASLGGADHKTPLYETPADTRPADFVPGALASWQDLGGTRWILVPTSGAIVAWKVADPNGAAALQPGWVSRDMVSPLTPMVVNGVIFAVSGGEPHAVLYALDSATGKELWNSGNTIGSPVHGGELSAGGSQLYLGTKDGTLYAFGFPIEH